MTGRYSPAETTLPLGSVLEDAYRLVRRIADGGMGTVYEAEQLRLGKRCAVKVMAPELAMSRDALARFHREVEVTSQLNHPHIVQVMDFGTAPGGAPFLVMEFLDGEDLAQRLRRTERLTPAATGHIVKQVASALAATHAGGIVHRDLKPANIFLITIAGASEADSDFVKVVDFGISKVKHAGPRLTRASVLMGTPQYMPPEQASGRIDAIDHRSDQWALGCIAWEMLAGRGPFWGKDVTALLYQIVHQDPLPEAARAAGLTAPVEEVLRRALAKKPRDRFPSITAFSRAFEAALTAPARSDSTRLMVGSPADALARAPAGNPAPSPSPWRLGTIFAPRVSLTRTPEAPPAAVGPVAHVAATMIRSLRTLAGGSPMVVALPPPPPPPSPMKTLLAAVTPVRLMATWKRVRRRRPRRIWLALAALPLAAAILLYSRGAWRAPSPAASVAVDRSPGLIKPAVRPGAHAPKPAAPAPARRSRTPER